MSDNTSNNTVPALNAPPPSSEAGPANHEVVEEEQGEEGTGGVALEPSLEANQDTSPENGDNAGIPANQPPANAVRVIADNTFNFFVGPGATCFTVDINDLRRESPLFRGIPCITSVELRQENPEAVQLIVNWFQGYVGEAPITAVERELFIQAGRIANQLQIKECEAQMLVIVDKSSRFLADVYLDILGGGVQVDGRATAERLMQELDGYMIRSPNQGGGDNDSDNEE